jgi:hypothetical protein
MAVFITPSGDAWHSNESLPNYAADVYAPGQWTYAFFIPSKLSDSFGSGALYDTANGTVQLVNVNGLPNPSNWIFRDGQAVQFIPNQSAPPAGGSWSLGVGTLTFDINDNGLLGDSFALSWAMTCGNDAISAGPAWQLNLANDVSRLFSVRLHCISPPQSGCSPERSLIQSRITCSEIERNGSAHEIDPTDQGLLHVQLKENQRASLTAAAGYGHPQSPRPMVDAGPPTFVIDGGLAWPGSRRPAAIPSFRNHYQQSWSRIELGMRHADCLVNHLQAVVKSCAADPPLAEVANDRHVTSHE